MLCARAKLKHKMDCRRHTRWSASPPGHRRHTALIANIAKVLANDHSLELGLDQLHSMADHVHSFDHHCFSGRGRLVDRIAT